MEKGCAGMEDDRRPSRRETGSQGHELSGLGIRGWEHLHRSVSAARRCKVNVEGLGCQGWLGPGRRVQTPHAEGTFRVERVKDASRRERTIRRLAQIEAASATALVTMPTTTWGLVLKEGARLSKQLRGELQYIRERQDGASMTLPEHSICLTW